MKQQLISFFVAMVIMASCFGLAALFTFFKDWSNWKITLMYLLFSGMLWVWFFVLLAINRKMKQVSKPTKES